MSTEKYEEELQRVVLQLEDTNKALYEINRNLANLVLLHQVQLVALEESLQVPENEILEPKKKIH
mgnify:FL=1|tara:strand:- start:820 stop:1014 length:195 start_codon:yes stop_codon:yes gene_type:complete